MVASWRKLNADDIFEYQDRSRRGWHACRMAVLLKVYQIGIITFLTRGLGLLWELGLQSGEDKWEPYLPCSIKGVKGITTATTDLQQVTDHGLGFEM